MPCCDCATELRRLRAELAAVRHATRTDPLTGLPNRTAFTAHRLELVDVEHTALLIDVNGFKAVNDTHGHAAGDRVLQTIAGRLAHAANDGRTVVARLAGDEFAAVVVGGFAAGQDVAGRLAAAVSAQPIPTPDGGRIWPTVSVGVALHRPGGDLAASLHAADEAMYARKPGRVPAGLIPVDLPRAGRFAEPTPQPSRSIR